MTAPLEDRVTQLEYDRHSLEGQVAAVAGAVNIVHGDVKALRSEMHTEFTAVRSEMHEGFAAVRSEMHEGFAAVRTEIGDLRGLVEAVLIRLPERDDD